MAAPNCVKFIKETFSKGQFEIWQCDNGRHLKNKAVKKIIEELGGHMVNSSPYHPQSNGVVERQNGTIKALFRMDVINMDLDKYHKKRHATIKMPPLLAETLAFPPEDSSTIVEFLVR